MFKSNHPVFLTLIKTAMLCLTLLLVSPAKAFGYADPGTGAFVYQAAYAAFLGGMFYLRRMLDRFWGGSSRRDAADNGSK